MFKNIAFKMEFGKPRCRNFVLDMCLTLRSLVSRLVLLYWLEPSVSNSDRKWRFLSLAKLPSWIRSWTWTFTTNEKRDQP